MKPTDSELEILQILWQSENQSVRSINDKLNDHREVGYTTTLKILQIMFEKGYVVRDTSKRSHIYKSNLMESTTKAGLIKDFVSNTFQGSISDMVLAAVGNSKTSDAELSELKLLIEQIENKKR
jgi:predicted transcriptional regulator